MYLLLFCIMQCLYKITFVALYKVMFVTLYKVTFEKHFSILKINCGRAECQGGPGPSPHLRPTCRWDRGGGHSSALEPGILSFPLTLTRVHLARALKPSARGTLTVTLGGPVSSTPSIALEMQCARGTYVICPSTLGRSP